jgi:hypothetical protein
MLKYEINHAFDLLKNVVIRINNNGKDKIEEKKNYQKSRQDYHLNKNNHIQNNQRKDNHRQNYQRQNYQKQDYHLNNDNHRQNNHLNNDNQIQNYHRQNNHLNNDNQIQNYHKQNYQKPNYQKNDNRQNYLQNNYRKNYPENNKQKNIQNNTNNLFLQQNNQINKFINSHVHTWEIYSIEKMDFPCENQYFIIKHDLDESFKRDMKENMGYWCEKLNGFIFNKKLEYKIIKYLNAKYYNWVMVDNRNIILDL